MATLTNGGAARLSDRPVFRRWPEGDPETEVSRCAQVFEAEDAIVVRIRLVDGPLELRVPRTAASRPPRHHHIPGFNPDATPC